MWTAKKCQVCNIILTYTLTEYLTSNTVFALVHKTIFYKDYILIMTQNVFNSYVP